MIRLMYRELNSPFTESTPVFDEYIRAKQIEWAEQEERKLRVMLDGQRIIEQQKETYTDGQWDRFWVGGVRRGDDVHRRPQWKQSTVGDVIERMNRDLGGRADAEYEIKE